MVPVLWRPRASTVFTRRLSSLYPQCSRLQGEVQLESIQYYLLVGPVEEENKVHCSPVLHHPRCEERAQGGSGELSKPLFCAQGQLYVHIRRLDVRRRGRLPPLQARLLLVRHELPLCPRCTSRERAASEARAASAQPGKGRALSPVAPRASRPASRATTRRARCARLSSGGVATPA